MADDLKRLVPSKSSVSTSPLPMFTLPPMPDRLRKISPELEQWEASFTAAVQRQLRTIEDKLNAVIDAQKTGE